MDVFRISSNIAHIAFVRQLLGVIITHTIIDKCFASTLFERIVVAMFAQFRSVAFILLMIALEPFIIHV